MAHKQDLMYCNIFFLIVKQKNYSITMKKEKIVEEERCLPIRNNLDNLCVCNVTAHELPNVREMMQGTLVSIHTVLISCTQHVITYKLVYLIWS